jgi:hypothetical protein
MPAFTFEKISPPVRRAPAPSDENKQQQRGVIFKILGRFVDPAGKHVTPNDDGVIARNQTKLPK